MMAIGPMAQEWQMLSVHHSALCGPIQAILRCRAHSKPAESCRQPHTVRLLHYCGVVSIQREQRASHSGPSDGR
jgi:hypothetical protein